MGSGRLRCNKTQSEGGKARRRPQIIDKALGTDFRAPQSTQDSWQTSTQAEFSNNSLLRLLLLSCLFFVLFIFFLLCDRCCNNLSRCGLSAFDSVSAVMSLVPSSFVSCLSFLLALLSGTSLRWVLLLFFFCLFFFFFFFLPSSCSSSFSVVLLHQGHEEWEGVGRTPPQTRARPEYELKGAFSRPPRPGTCEGWAFSLGRGVLRKPRPEEFLHRLRKAEESWQKHSSTAPLGPQAVRIGGGLASTRAFCDALIPLMTQEEEDEEEAEAQEQAERERDSTQQDVVDTKNLENQTCRDLGVISLMQTGLGRMVTPVQPLGHGKWADQQVAGATQECTRTEKQRVLRMGGE